MDIEWVRLRTLSFYLLIIILLLTNVGYISRGDIIVINIIIIGLIAYLSSDLMLRNGNDKS